MRHGYSDETDNGWGDVVETRPETAEETAARHAYVDEQEAKRRLQSEAEVFSGLVVDALKRQAATLFPNNPHFPLDRETIRSLKESAEYRYVSTGGNCEFPVRVFMAGVCLYFMADGCLRRD